MDSKDYSPGDLVFAHGKGFISAAIRLVQSWRSPKADAHWNHVAILSHKIGDEWQVIQAQGKGVVMCPLSDVAPGGSFEVVACPAVDREKVTEFACSQEGVKYGYLTVASIILNVVTPKRLALRKPGTWICSALAAACLWYAGWYESENWPDLYQVSPADLYGAL